LIINTAGEVSSSQCIFTLKRIPAVKNTGFTIRGAMFSTTKLADFPNERISRIKITGVKITSRIKNKNMERMLLTYSIGLKLIKPFF